jgi:hypothetical protein
MTSPQQAIQHPGHHVRETMAVPGWRFKIALTRIGSMPDLRRQEHFDFAERVLNFVSHLVGLGLDRRENIQNLPDFANYAKLRCESWLYVASIADIANR